MKMDGLEYVGKGENNSDIFHCIADGNRPVLEIAVDVQDNIWIGRVGVSGFQMQMTKGKIHRHPLDESDEILSQALIGEPPTDVCVDSIAQYIVPRIATMMARVYCPKVTV
jgi:hypothetical protein